MKPTENSLSNSARDLVMVLRRYGFLGIAPGAGAAELAERSRVWWPDSPLRLADGPAPVAVIHPRGNALAAHGIQCRQESGPAFLLEKSGWKWWPRQRRVYQALLPHCSFSGPDVEPVWHNAAGRAVLAWWHRDGHKVPLIGLDLAEELIRYSQGDRSQLAIKDRARFNFAFERANYLFDTNLVPGAPSIPWADRLGFTVADMLAQSSGMPLVEPLPGGARGLVLLTGDDDQAALATYREQLELVGDFPITYFLLPFTKHTPQTLAALPANVELGLHVDALEQPERYDGVCADQVEAVRRLCARPIRSVRNHGFLNRGYLGHLQAWENCGLALDVNYAGLDGTALTGSFLPFLVRRADGTWSDHVSLLTAFGDGMQFICKFTEEQSNARIEALAKQIEESDPGVLCFNMHPENIGQTRKIHRCIMDLGRRPGWRALGVNSYLDWLSEWQNITVRREGDEFVLDGARSPRDIVLRVPRGQEWERLPMPAQGASVAA